MYQPIYHLSMGELKCKKNSLYSVHVPVGVLCPASSDKLEVPGALQPLAPDAVLCLVADAELGGGVDLNDGAHADPSVGRGRNVLKDFSCIASQTKPNLPGLVSVLGLETRALADDRF